MQLSNRAIYVAVNVLAACAFCAAGCQQKKPPQAVPAARIDYTQPLPQGQLALEKIAPSAYPDFSRSLQSTDVKALRKSAANSLTWFSRPGSAKKYPYLDIDHARAAASAKALIDLIDAGAFSLPAGEFNRAIAGKFDVYQSIGAPTANGSAYTHKVLFTGYFTPTYDASLTRGGEYQWPLYKRPADLISDAQADTASRRLADGTTVPYLTRREIESGALAGDELVWLSSRWNAYVITVQGSARLRLPDGKIMEVGYAGVNGRAYLSPGLKMIADGVIAEKDLSFETMRQYFTSHPEAMDKYLWQNPRTVFFKEVHGGPFGALNVPVTKFASIATDKDVYPPGMPAFLKVPIPALENDLPRGSAGEFSGFVLDQDRGGAIRSAGRCDIYMGIGQRAEQTAGHQLDAGELYYLVAKE
ncbi:MAG TPA: MltA domain-containing protein [Tepidisphaeraceae bacterium]|nr:MltA domain-containing protein [Tepidisphaeraceae bacterium]